MVWWKLNWILACSRSPWTFFVFFPSYWLAVPILIQEKTLGFTHTSFLGSNTKPLIKHFRFLLEPLRHTMYDVQSQGLRQSTFASRPRQNCVNDWVAIETQSLLCCENMSPVGHVPWVDLPPLHCMYLKTSGTGYLPSDFPLQKSSAVTAGVVTSVSRAVSTISSLDFAVWEKIKLELLIFLYIIIIIHEEKLPFSVDFVVVVVVVFQ